MAKGRRTTAHIASLVPSFAEEQRYHSLGYRNVAGVDEVGRGALAGPVVAAAVILPPGMNDPWLSDVRDSKLLDPARRQSLSSFVKEKALAIGIGSVPSEIIDSIGIVKATELAMTRAIEQLSPAPQALLVDFFRLPGILLPQKGVPDGDSLCLSIACASIVAKVARDRMMAELDDVYPGYGLEEHKGYGTKGHFASLARLGPSPVHRRSFSPVRQAQGSPVRQAALASLKTGQGRPVKDAAE